MIIDCISDLHGYYPKLDGGDLLIIAGDITANDTYNQWIEFLRWITDLNYRKVIFIGGNHDNLLTSPEECANIFTADNAPWHESRVEYLCDRGCEFEGLKIWGSPWSVIFPGVHPKCSAFMSSETILRKKFIKIPEKLDILVTHTPPQGILDINTDGKHCGSYELRAAVYEKNPKYHIFGHIHESHGTCETIIDTRKKRDSIFTTYINCSLVNERYKPTFQPKRIII